jgi:probable F420-dependent oxidoreductase
VRIDILFHPTDQGPSIAKVAAEAEAAGIGAIWVPDHSHIPVGGSAPRGSRAGASALPPHYQRLLDQFVALTVAATATSTIGLGTGVTVVSQRDPIYLAKQVASLDLVSDGRVIFGVGYGWNHDEMRAHGVDVTRRRGIVAEKLRTCKELWLSEIPEMHGEYVDFGPCFAWPKPVQRPHPPILVGASPTERTLRDIAALADGWLPIDDGRYPIEANWRRLQVIVEQRGEDPSHLILGAVCPSPDPARLAELRKAGAAFAVVDLHAASEATTWARLEQCATWAAELTAT